MPAVDREAPTFDDPSTPRALDPGVWPGTQDPARRPRTVLADRNLATVGYFSASSHRVRIASKHVTLSRRASEPSSATILAAGSLGQPSTADLDKLVAMPLVARNWPDSGPPVNPIRFATADLLKVLHLHPRSGKHYRDVREWMDVLTATTIVSDHAVFFAGRRRYVRERVHVFDRAVSAGEVLPDGSMAEENYVWLSAWQLENLAHGYTFALNFEQYRRLQRPVARTLALPLHVWLAASRDRGWFAKRCSNLCQFLGLRSYAHRSKIIEKVGPALDELQREGFIAAWAVAPTRDREDLKVVFRHRDGAARPRAATPPATQDAAGPANRETHQIIEDLVRRGLHRGPALRLLARIPADQPVARQIQWFDRLLASRGGESIRNPPAFLYRLVRDGTLPPADLPAGGAPANPPARPPTSDHYQLLQAYRRYVTDAVAAHVAALSDEERERLLAEHWAAVLEEAPQAKRWPHAQQQAAAKHRLEVHLSKTLPLRKLHVFLDDHSPTPPGLVELPS